MFFCGRIVQVTFVEKPPLKIISFQNHSQWYLIHTLSDKSFNGTVGNRALHENTPYYSLFVKDACVSTEDGFEDIEDEEEENEEEAKCRFPWLKT